MDPLKELWALYEAVMEKPPLQDESFSVTVEALQKTKTTNTLCHKNDARWTLLVLLEWNQNRLTRLFMVRSTLVTATSKAQLAATLARVQNDGGKKGIKIEKDKEFKSLLARDDELEQNDAVTPDDMRTPQQKEVPNALQALMGWRTLLVNRLKLWTFGIIMMT